MKQSWRLELERLEKREVPASYGVAWPDPLHLKLSLVPDGTVTDAGPSAQSSLFQSLNANAATSDWQTVILRAAQTWAANTNINVGLVSDGGQAIGAPGAVQGDSRFGDIRLSAFPLASDVLAVGAPYDPLAGTRSGEVFLNSQYQFGINGAPGQNDLFKVVLHELGHPFGLGDNGDTSSIMYVNYNNNPAVLSSSDISAVQAQYGARQPDQYEGYFGNNSLYRAASISALNVQGDITTNSDVDYYRFTLPTWTSGDVTVTVQSAGLSLLVPKLTVFNANQTQVGTVTASGPLNNTVTIDLGNAQPGTTYYFKVEGGTTDVFGIGAYRLKINAGADSASQIAALDAVYDGTTNRGVVSDGHTNDTQATATALSYRSDARFDYTVNASVEDSTDVDYYNVTAPSGWSPVTLVASVAALDSSGLHPVVSVYNASGQQMTADVLVNDGGTYIIQVANAQPGASYSVKVAAAPDAGSGHNVGNYVLGVNFRADAQPIDTLAGNTLSSTTSGALADTYTMSVPQTGDVLLSLQLSAPNATVPVAARLRVFDADGNIVLTLDVLNGQTTSVGMLLKKGTYSARLVAATQDGSALPSTTYSLRGKSLTDPIDPSSDDPAPPPPTSNPNLTTGGTPPTDPTQNPWTGP